MLRRAGGRKACGEERGGGVLRRPGGQEACGSKGGLGHACGEEHSGDVLRRAGGRKACGSKGGLGHACGEEHSGDVLRWAGGWKPAARRSWGGRPRDRIGSRGLRAATSLGGWQGGGDLRETIWGEGPPGEVAVVVRFPFPCR